MSLTATGISAAVLLVLAAAGMLFIDIRRRRLIAQLLNGSPNQPLPSLKNPWSEVALGVLITLAILFLAIVSLAGKASVAVSFVIAFASTLATSFSACRRSSAALFELGLPKDEKRLLWMLRGFYLGMAVLLCAILTGVLVFMSAYQGLFSSPAAVV